MNELVTHNPDNFLFRREAAADFLTQGADADAIQQFLHYFEINVRLEERQPHLAQSFIYHLLVESSLHAEVLEHSLKLIL